MYGKPLDDNTKAVIEALDTAPSPTIKRCI
jgi:hypothetical protein